jgi:hypothetical protein
MAATAGFEPASPEGLADLQSAPINLSGTSPLFIPSILLLFTRFPSVDGFPFSFVSLDLTTTHEPLQYIVNAREKVIVGCGIDTHPDKTIANAHGVHPFAISGQDLARQVSQTHCVCKSRRKHGLAFHQSRKSDDALFQAGNPLVGFLPLVLKFAKLLLGGFEGYLIRFFTHIVFRALYRSLYTMSKAKSSDSLHTASARRKGKAPSGWAMAAKDAEELMQQAERRLVELKAALAVCIERRDSGEPWPGENRKKQTRVASG